MAETRTDPLDRIFAALADPTRRRILGMLLEDDLAISDVADAFDISLAAISKHLGVLARAGLVSQDRRGRVTWCKVEPDAMRAATVFIQGFGQYEPINLDAYERFLAAELKAASHPSRKLSEDEADDGDDDDHEADDIDDVVHSVSFRNLA